MHTECKHRQPVAFNMARDTVMSMSEDNWNPVVVGFEVCLLRGVFTLMVLQGFGCNAIP